MAANLYARSIFGEDVLANLSIEKPNKPDRLDGGPDAPVVGHVRIRAKSQVCHIYNMKRAGKMQHVCQISHSEVVYCLFMRIVRS